ADRHGRYEVGATDANEMRQGGDKAEQGCRFSPMGAAGRGQADLLGAAPSRPCTTMSARVPATMVLISDCSAWGTAKLSRVWWRSSRKASHSAAVILRSWCDALMTRTWSI